MSVVGPRPALWNQDVLISERDKYHANNVKPGLTGLAQINGRDKLEIPDKAKLDGIYCQNIGLIMDMCIVIDNPKSFSSELNTVVQIGVELAPYAISGVTLIIIELIKNRKKIKIKVSDNGFEVEGDEEKALKIAKELIEQKQEEKAQKVLSDLLSGK